MNPFWKRTFLTPPFFGIIFHLIIVLIVTGLLEVENLGWKSLTIAFILLLAIASAWWNERIRSYRIWLKTYEGRQWKIDKLKKK